MTPKFNIGDVVRVVCNYCSECDNTVGRIVCFSSFRGCYDYDLQVLRGKPCSINFVESDLVPAISSALVDSVKQRKRRDHAGI